MRISDWSSDVCSSDLPARRARARNPGPRRPCSRPGSAPCASCRWILVVVPGLRLEQRPDRGRAAERGQFVACNPAQVFIVSHRSAEHTSELQSLMRITYAVFCLTYKIDKQTQQS